MKLYDAAWAPSPRRVRVYLAEKAIQVERVPIDLATGEHLGEAYRALVPREHETPRGPATALVVLPSASARL